MTTNAKPYVTPLVRAEAARNGVDLDTVTGTGVGGRIRLQDMQPQARALPAPVAQATVSVPARSFMQEQRSFITGMAVTIDLYAKNPLVDDAKLSSPTVYAQAVKQGPAPTLFASGDLPPMLASGEDPKILLALPWFARHPAARADRPRLARMLEWAAEDLGGAVLVLEGYGENSDCYDYQGRVFNWLQGKPSEQAPPPGWDEFLAQNGLS